MEQLQLAQAAQDGGLGLNGAASAPPRKNLCAKCALREEENGIYRCESAPLKPFETTC